MQKKNNHNTAEKVLKVFIVSINTIKKSSSHSLKKKFQRLSRDNIGNI